MRLLFATDNIYRPQMTGGAEVSISIMCRHLRRDGHDCAVTAQLGRSGFTHIINRIQKKLLRDMFHADWYQGVRVYRDWSYVRSCELAIKRHKPDAVVLMKNSQTLFELCLANGVATVLYLQDTLFKDLDFSNADPNKFCIIANSKFTARKFEEKFDIPAFVLPPIIEPPTKIHTSNGNKILFINPIKKKGSDIAVHLFTNHPNEQFLVCESWPLTQEVRRCLEDSLSPLSNVEWLPPQKDMTSIYQRTKLVLMPSQCDEAWGRVASEAQLFGIPVLASNTGGLPEAVGEGGLLVDDFRNPSAWDSALTRVTGDKALSSFLASEALLRSRQGDTVPETNIKKLMSQIQTLYLATH